MPIARTPPPDTHIHHIRPAPLGWDDEPLPDDETFIDIEPSFPFLLEEPMFASPTVLSALKAR